MTHKGEGYVPKRTSFGCQELYISYDTIKTCSLTLHVAYLLTWKKPKVGPLPRCRNTLLGTWRVVRWDGQMKQHKSGFICFEFLDMYYLHIC